MSKAYCLKIPKKLGEKAIQLIKSLNLLNPDLKIAKEEYKLLIPLIREPSNAVMTRIKQDIDPVELSTSNFQLKRKKTQTLSAVLKEIIPSPLLLSLPKSYDITGQVIIIEVPSDINEYEKQLGEGLIKIYPNIKTVLSKQSAISGESRLRKYKIIAGSGETETVHKENGCLYHIDPVKAYFSPRLAFEHNRISNNVKDGENVIDMFAGVGPFAIQIAKRHKDVKVYAIDLNPDAFQFLEKNIKTNKVKSKVVPILGDAREIIERDLIGTADRIIMNLPKDSIKFIDTACTGIKSSGGIIHYYEFAGGNELFKRAKERLRNAVLKNGRQIKGIVTCRKVRATAPHEWQIVLDAFIH